MNCVHCNNTPGEIYTHEANEAVCHHCQASLDSLISKVKYLGITQISGKWVHNYIRITPLSCHACGIQFDYAFYHCKDDMGAESQVAEVPLEVDSVIN